MSPTAYNVGVVVEPAVIDDIGQFYAFVVDPAAASSHGLDINGARVQTRAAAIDLQILNPSLPTLDYSEWEFDRRWVNCFSNLTDSSTPPDSTAGQGLVAAVMNDQAATQQVLWVWDPRASKCHFKAVARVAQEGGISTPSWSGIAPNVGLYHATIEVIPGGPPVTVRMRLFKTNADLSSPTQIVTHDIPGAAMHPNATAYRVLDIHLMVGSGEIAIQVEGQQATPTTSTLRYWWRLSYGGSVLDHRAATGPEFNDSPTVAWPIPAVSDPVGFPFREGGEFDVFQTFSTIAPGSQSDFWLPLGGWTNDGTQGTVSHTGLSGIEYNPSSRKLVAGHMVPPFDSGDPPIVPWITLPNSEDALGFRIDLPQP